jgi:hypothetical protein
MNRQTWNSGQTMNIYFPVHCKSGGKRGSQSGPRMHVTRRTYAASPNADRTDLSLVGEPSDKWPKARISRFGHLSCLGKQ